MKDRVESRINTLLQARKRRQRWVVLLLVLAVLAAAGPFYAFRLNAIAKTHQKRVLDCAAESGAVSHIHNDDCFVDDVLVCPLEEIEPHEHTEECFESILSCGLEENNGHQHDESCWAEEAVLSCGMDEHTHDDSCYETVLICGDEESEGTEEVPGHTHDDSCYETVLSCPLEEHLHNDSCYETHQYLTCGLVEGEGAHHHDESCYELVLTCEKPVLPVHRHTSECFQMVEMTAEEIEALGEEEEGAEAEIADVPDEGAEAESGEAEPQEKESIPAGDPYADVETEAEWTAAFENLELSGDWSQDLLTVAKTQIGYTESSKNYFAEQNDNGYTLHSYSRYGAWAGAPYADWKAMFAAFCIYYSGSWDYVPVAYDAAEWVELLAESEMLSADIADLVFVDQDEDGKADLVGIVCGAGDENIIAIVGDHTVQVEEFGYDDVVAYSMIPQNPEYAAEEPVEEPEITTEEAAQTPLRFEALAGNVLVTVEANADAFPVGTVMKAEPVYDEAVISSVADAASGSVVHVQAVDITFLCDGEEIEPTRPIRVTMVPAELPETDAVVEQEVIHIDHSGEATLVEQKESTENEVIFDADSFSVYAIAYVVIEKNVIASDGETYHISLSYDAAAGIPENAELAVTEILPDTDEYKAYMRLTDETIENEMVSFARFFDIAIIAEGIEIQPAAPVDVKIELADEMDESVKAVHFGEGVEVIDAFSVPVDEETEAETTVSEVSFSAESFSVYGVILTTLEKTITASDGNSYQINITFGADAKIPLDAELRVEEIVRPAQPEEADEAEEAGEADSEKTAGEETEDANLSEYDSYLELAAEVLGWDTGLIPYARFFDISIVNADGEKIQPAEGSIVSVNVRLEEYGGMNAESKVVHFKEESAEVLANTAEGNTVVFVASSFSVYAIVDAPDPVITEGTQVQNLSELAQKYNYESGFYLSYGNTKYFTNTLNSGGCFVETSNVSEASRWYFEAVEGSENPYVIYTFVNEEKQYMQNTSGNLMGLTTELSSAVSFEISQPANTDSKFYFKKSGENKWLQHSNGGGGIRFYTDNNNTTNSRISITYAVDGAMDKDPYSLVGKTYGIAYHNDSAIAAALTADSNSTQTTLTALDMIMRPDVLDNDGILLVAEGSDIQEWTFLSIEEDKYYITTEVGGVTKYLVFEGANVSLTDVVDMASVITATPGTGSNSGKWHFMANGYSLNLSGTEFNAATGSGDTTWMNLVEKSGLNDDDFNLYTAQKVSVSDTEKVYDGRQVVIYTRVWNDTTKKYEFYAVDHDGSLIRCYDTGDNIEWIGSKVNTALWAFTEGTNSDGTPSYYYWLENTQYDHTFIVPQVTSNQVIYTSAELDGTSDFSASVNLNGRRYGEAYTPIICWDDDQYSYSGLKVENGRVVPCVLAEAEDFYFAIVKQTQEAPEVTTVATVDSNAYGITMRMVDFNNEVKNERDSYQTEIMGTTGGGKGLVSTGLTDNYPTVLSNNNSLSALFSGSAPANHLFLQSIYNESGYFEYDSTQNFAHLNDDGNFTVYDQIGAIIGKDEHKNTREHGQFMPYNDISGEKGYAVDTSGNVITNRTDVNKNELSDLDARKDESLYLIGDNRVGVQGQEGGVDYYFGMELEASFTQTASGLDAWGHDIIFEFSGDDDFWLYVDGELVIDLGGVHEAQTGSVNFRTGEIKSSNGNSTLYKTFKEHYEARGMSAAEVTEKLNELFEQKTINGKTYYVFRDYTNHTMRMFYMERGAGASNLHMRFNLAAVKPGTVELSKKLSGTDTASNGLIEFPYQIYYKMRSDGGNTYHLLTEKTGDVYNVTYKDTVNPVTYLSTFKPAGGTESYEHVFFLKAGETAVINLPDDTIDYYIVECGINPDVYDHVYANGAEITGTGTGNTVGTTARKDYATGAASTADRPAVEYDNHVSDGAMRTLNITKLLYNTDGETLLHYDATEEEKAAKLEDKTVFEYRLYLGGENADPNNLQGAYLYPYYVKNRAGYYCKWDSASKKFISLGINDFSALQAYLATLTAAEKETIVFTTSPNGAISKIPSDYTVEVRDLIIGSQWRVNERDWDIPKGYTRREADGYVRTDAGHETQQSDPISGTMAANDSPEVQIRNQRGWGLTVKKNWTDKDFMSSHDTIYFAIYVYDSGEDDYALVPVYKTVTVTEEDGTEITRTVIDYYKPSVRQMTTDITELYYFFGDLHNNTEKTYEFSNYYVREVAVAVKDTASEGTSIEVDDEGYVTNLDVLTVTPISGRSDDNTLVTGGTPVGGAHQDNLSYTVSYAVGKSTGENENIRTDTVTNSRPGIELYKKDWDGNNLAGAVFTLKDNAGNNVAAATYTSGSDGLITTAYLNPGTYLLTEIITPKGYVVLDNPITITVNSDESLSFSMPNGTGTDTITLGADGTVTGSSTFVSVVKNSDSNMTATVVIKDRSNALNVIKKDASSNDPIAGVHFALYHQVTDNDGTKRKDYNPIPGYADLVTDADGIIPNITTELAAGTYYLTETEAAEGYDTLTDDLCFTIGNDGTVTISGAGVGTLTKETDLETGKTTYSITILNGKIKKVSFKKVDIATPSYSALSGAVFDLYKVVDGSREDTAMFRSLTSGTDGMLSKDGTTVFELSLGIYHLIETEAPAGYNMKSEPVVITVSESNVTYDDGTTLSVSGSGVVYDETMGTFTLLITNQSGYELPSTGGPGTALYSFLGAVLTILSGAALVKKKWC